MTGLWVAPSPTDKQEQVFFPVATTVNWYNTETLPLLQFLLCQQRREGWKGEKEGMNEKRFNLNEWLEAKYSHVKKQMVSTKFKSGCYIILFSMQLVQQYQVWQASKKFGIRKLQVATQGSINQYGQDQWSSNTKWQIRFTKWLRHEVSKQQIRCKTQS